MRAYTTIRTLLSVALLVACIRRAFAGSCAESKLCCPGRDSACVVQKTSPNAIVQRYTDKPCYCDHACLKLGDCCHDFKEACGGEWAILSLLLFFFFKLETIYIYFEALFLYFYSAFFFLSLLLLVEFRNLNITLKSKTFFFQRSYCLIHK